MVNTNQNSEPNKRKIVRQSIGVDLLGYENLIHSFFVSWCEILSQKFKYKNRELIINESIWKYYQNQWAILVENRLINDYGSYMEKDLPDTFSFYYKILYEYAEELDRYYPAVLLPKTKISKTDKYQFNQN